MENPVRSRAHRERAPPLSPAILRSGGNHLLAAMPMSDLSTIAKCARRVRFARREVLCGADEAAPAAFFIEDGVASVVKPADGSRKTEICLIGPDSFFGSAIILTDGSWPFETFVQSDEIRAIEVRADGLRALFAESPSARSILGMAIHLQTVQIAGNLAAAVWSQLAPRLARWLLMYRDRLRSDRLEVTHEFMAMMIGAQRTRVTSALHELESGGAIVAKRGYVLIRDPALLERLSDGCYGAIEKEVFRAPTI